MAIEIDGAAVLRTIVERPQLFPEASQEFARTARTLVARELKAKGTGLAGAQAIADAIGTEAMTLIVDGLGDAEVKALVGRLDRGAPDRLDVRIAEPTALRKHLLALTSGQAEAAASPPVPDETTTAPTLRHASVQAKRKKDKGKKK